jgi:F-type H+-transporting ATPase subunit gamma
MSGTLESLRRKIDGAGDLEGVVRSMKALAASSIGQYEKAVQSLDDYYRTVELALVACLHQAGPVSLGEGKRSPHERQHEGKIGAVVFGSDQGLVGRFNEVIVEFAVHELKTLPGSSSFPSDGRDLP